MQTLPFVAAALLLSTSALAADLESSSDSSRTLAMPESSAGAPEADHSNTLFGRKQLAAPDNAWYVAPTLGVTTIGGDATFEGGVRASYRLNRRFGIGLAAMGWDGPKSGARSQDGGFVGPMFEMVLWKDSVVHVATQTVVGGGFYCGAGVGRDDDSCRDAYGFFAVDSTLNLEVNVTNNVHVLIGGGRRFALADNDGPLSSNDLSGFVARTSIAIGQF